VNEFQFRLFVLPEADGGPASLKIFEVAAG
jgi:hypothetical protein